MIPKMIRPPSRTRSFILRSEPDITSIYGPGVSGDALGNSSLAGPGGAIKTLARFRAEQTSPLTSIYFAYLSADYPGYGGGTGGNWRLRLHDDDETENHFPKTAYLASVDVAPAATSDNDKQVTFSAPYTVTKGKIYHLVFENVDADPITNFCSMNNWVRKSVDSGEIPHPKYPNFDLGTAYYYGGTWIERRNYLPLIQINYGNGQVQGMSYGEASYAEPLTVGEINGGTKMVRERFTISGEEVVASGVGIRVLRTASTSTDLFVSLRDQYNSEIETVRIPVAEIMVGPAPTYGSAPDEWDDLGANARWVSVNFSGAYTLEVGKEYSVRLSSSGGTYWAWVMRRMTSGYLYADATAFYDGFAEYTLNGGSSWSGLGRVPGDSDLQFYLKTLVR